MRRPQGGADEVEGSGVGQPPRHRKRRGLRAGECHEPGPRGSVARRGAAVKVGSSRQQPSARPDPGRDVVLEILRGPEGTRGGTGCDWGRRGRKESLSFPCVVSPETRKWCHTGGSRPRPRRREQRPGPMWKGCREARATGAKARGGASAPRSPSPWPTPGEGPPRRRGRSRRACPQRRWRHRQQASRRSTWAVRPPTPQRQAD